MRRALAFLAVVVCAASEVGTSSLPAHTEYAVQSARPNAAQSSLSDVQRYISDTWDTLTRSPVRCESYADPKAASARVLYLPVDISEPDSVRNLTTRCGISVARLPWKIDHPGDIDLRQIPTEGLLYLENPYVVPGGQFNEMYGWDSYFIVLGLLRDGRIELAKGMVENFFFEIEHYGTILNANRTYYLTRSQPPFLTSMILAVYKAEKDAGKPDRAWLETAYRYAVRDYGEWVRDVHLAGDTGLSRYFDNGEGPVPEMGEDSSYYRGVASFFFAHRGISDPHLVPVHDPDHPSNSVLGGVFSVPGFANPTPANHARRPLAYVALSPGYYKGDRSMRESGFDVSFRFGAFGAETHHYAPVCLNSLLYKEEADLAAISDLLGHAADSAAWLAKAAERQKEINRLLWDGSRGLFFDYDFVEHRRSTYEYATTFYPLWAGLASAEQAGAVVRKLGRFERSGGLVMSRNNSRTQWDFPYGWAPIELLAVEGLRRYGYNAQADRIAFEFLLTVLEDFRRTGTIHEKYNVVTSSAEVHIEAGYKQNVVGFGWTNAVFLELLHSLTPSAIEKLNDH